MQHVSITDSQKYYEQVQKSMRLRSAEQASIRVKKERNKMFECTFHP